MEKIKTYYKEHKDRLIKAIILAVVLIAAFITVYIFKHISDYPSILMAMAIAMNGQKKLPAVDST